MTWEEGLSKDISAPPRLYGQMENFPTTACSHLREWADMGLGHVYTKFYLRNHK